MSAETWPPFVTVRELRDGCDRRNCTNAHIGSVRFEGESVSRRLCRPCRKEFLGVSS